MARALRCYHHSSRPPRIPAPAFAGVTFFRRDDATEPSSTTMDPLQAAVHSYILNEFLPGAKPSELTPSTPLISGGVLDSLATVRLVAFLEDQYRITIEPHEASVDYLDTI